MRIFLGALILSLLMMTPAAGGDYQNAAREILEHVVSIESPGDAPGSWNIHGGGVAVVTDDALGILTANHVAAGLPPYVMVRACSALYPSRCIFLNAYKAGPNDQVLNDWKVYEVHDLPSVIVPVRQVDLDPEIGIHIRQVGYPSGNLLLVHGTLSGVAWGSNEGILVVQGMGALGSSGGPVFANDGRLLGVVSAVPFMTVPPYRDEPAGHQVMNNIALVVPLNERMFK